MTPRHRLRTVFAVVTTVTLASVGLSGVADAQVIVVDPLTVTPSSGTGATQVTASIDPTWAEPCVVTEDQPLGINVQTSETPGDGIISSVLLLQSDPSYTSSVDEWMFNSAYPAGTYWFVAFCTTAGGPITDSVPFVVPTGSVPKGLGLSLDPTTGSGTTSVAVTVGPPFTDGFIPCPADDTSTKVSVSRSSDVLDASAVVHSTPIPDPIVPETVTHTLDEWLGGALAQGQYWFFASCPSINNPAFTAYSNAVAFTAPTPLLTTLPVAVAPSFTG